MSEGKNFPICLQTMLLHWNTLVTPTSPHALQPASQTCHQTASFLPSQLHHSSANSTSHLFHLIVSKFFLSAAFSSLPKGISYMTNPFLYIYFLVLWLLIFSSWLWFISHELLMRFISFPKLLS